MLIKPISGVTGKIVSDSRGESRMGAKGKIHNKNLCASPLLHPFSDVELLTLIFPAGPFFPSHKQAPNRRAPKKMTLFSIPPSIFIIQN